MASWHKSMISEHQSQHAMLLSYMAFGHSLTLRFVVMMTLVRS